MKLLSQFLQFVFLGVPIILHSILTGDMKKRHNEAIKQIHKKVNR